MKLTGGRIVVRALEDAGIDLAFGIPGTHNIELYDALAESDAVRTVLVTDEQSASFMADGAWRASGRMACVNVVPGAGLTHAMSGVAEAFLDNVPMLVLGCGIRRDTGRAFQLHDVDQRAMIAPVTKTTFLPRTGAELYAVIRAACELARGETPGLGAPGPVFVEVPAELYLFEHEVDFAEPPRVVLPVTGGLPPLAEAVRPAVERIREAERPLLYVGAGCLGATDEVLRLAEHLDALVSTTFQGKGVFPEDHPLFLWPGYGLTAPPRLRALADECDLTIAVGARFSEVGTGSYALEPKGPLIHIDIDGEVFGKNFETAVRIEADAREALVALLEALGPDPREVDEKRRSRLLEEHAALWRDGLDDAPGGRVQPALLLRTAQEVFGPDTVYTTDSGNGTFLAMEWLRLDRARRFLAPVDYSCMGYAVPAALGAKLAVPRAPVVALAGDGAFLMTGLEALTAAELGLGVVILVLRDRELAQIAQFQGTAMNRRVDSEVYGYELEHLAAGLGVPFLRMGTNADVERVLSEARRVSAQGPVMVEVEVDYSRKTWFTRGVVKANLHRLPLRDRVRFIGRALLRRVTG